MSLPKESLALPKSDGATSPALSDAPSKAKATSRWALAIETIRSNRSRASDSTPRSATTPKSEDTPTGRSVVSDKVTENLRKWHKQVIYRDLERGEGLRIDRKHKQWLTAQLDRITADLPEPLRVDLAVETAPIVKTIADSYERYLGVKSPITQQARVRQEDLELVSGGGIRAEIGK